MRIDATLDPSPTRPALIEVQPVEVSDDATQTRTDDPWRVILFNDDVHTFDDVIYQIVVATSCPVNRASALAWQVHTTGKAAVFDGRFEDCFRVQAVLREIELITELRG